jgi:UrcA family protein
VLPEVVVDVQNLVVEGQGAVPENSTRHVSMGDLDLSTVQGACMALKRIRSAADDVCPYEVKGALNLQGHRQQCLIDSVARAVRATHSAQLEALRTGQSPACLAPAALREVVVDAQGSMGGKVAENATRHVPMDDLDLTTVRGACVALKRIKSVADDVCRDTRDLSRRQQCLNDSVLRAVQATHSTQVEALRTGPSPGC